MDELNIVRPEQRTQMKFHSDFSMDVLQLGSQLTQLEGYFIRSNKSLGSNYQNSIKIFKKAEFLGNLWVKYCAPWLSLLKMDFWHCDLKGRYKLKAETLIDKCNNIKKKKINKQKDLRDSTPIESLRLPYWKSDLFLPLDSDEQIILITTEEGQPRKCCDSEKTQRNKQKPFLPCWEYHR